MLVLFHLQSRRVDMVSDPVPVGRHVLEFPRVSRSDDHGALSIAGNVLRFSNVHSEKQMLFIPRLPYVRRSDALLDVGSPRVFLPICRVTSRHEVVSAITQDRYDYGIPPEWTKESFRPILIGIVGVMSTVIMSMA